jgi:hypothetical protein
MAQGWSASAPALQEMRGRRGTGAHGERKLRTAPGLELHGS